MRCDPLFLRNMLRLYAVTDRRWLRGKTLCEQVEQAILGGVTCVQLREKELEKDAFYEEAVRMRALCSRYRVPLIINDDVEIALACGADGVHVGASDMEIGEIRKRAGDRLIIGATAKTVKQALAAQAAGADYLGSGAVFGTATKPDAKPMTMARLREITESVSIPVVAIGGIDEANIGLLKGSGIAGAAVVSGVFAGADIRLASQSLRTQIDEMLIEQGGEHMQKVKTALTIAGSDSSGGAGIQADIKTMSAHGVYAMSAITALTAQNTTGVSAIEAVSPAFLKSQIDSVFSDIRPDAVKTGMVAGSALIAVIAERLLFYGAKNIVVDPVMIATSGSRLLDASAVDVLKRELLPLAAVVTPNIPEAMALGGMEIRTQADMECAARAIEAQCGCAVLLKGGHCIGRADDLLCKDGSVRWFRGERIDNPNTHGTGCTLSSAIAARLALGDSLEAAIDHAKKYISGALRAGLDLGRGSGPLDHMYTIR